MSYQNDSFTTASCQDDRENEQMTLMKVCMSSAYWDGLCQLWNPLLFLVEQKMVLNFNVRLTVLSVNTDQRVDQP